MERRGRDLTANLPVRKWISRVVPSQHADGTVYVSQRGREDDDFAPYVYKSTDYGKTFTRIVANLPAGPVNVIRESPTRPESPVRRHRLRRRSCRWTAARSGRCSAATCPSVQVSDLQYQGRDNIIVIATYGRGMFALDAMKLQ